MCWPTNHLLRFAVLNYFATMHNYNSLRNTINYAKIMTHANKCEAPFIVGLLDKRQNFIGNPHVESRSWFIEQQNMWVSGQSECDEYALLLASRQFMRISQLHCLAIETHLAEQCNS